MSGARRKDIAASVRQRLLNISRDQGEDFQLVLTRFALERFLYRLSRCRHAGVFVLKGAMLFSVWTGKPHRPTRDLDLLATGDPTDERLKELLGDVCKTEVEPDGVEFKAETISISPIREDDEYQGRRVRIGAVLGRLRIPLQIDLGFGDVVTPAAEMITYPSLLDFPPPQIRVYTRESVIAEKLQAMVALGLLNSRMKDFYDLWVMSRRFRFDGVALTSAIRATFRRRKTGIPSEIPSALSDEFAVDPEKSTQWAAFLRRNKLEGESVGLNGVVQELREFLVPPLHAAAEGGTFNLHWDPGGKWS